MSGTYTGGEVIIIGGGIGGLTLALVCHRAGIPCRVYETVAEPKPLGVGINLLPHAMKQLSDLGMMPRFEKHAVETKEAAFFNRFGQLIYREPAGRFAGWAYPQLSIHRGLMYMDLYHEVLERLGADSVVLNTRTVRVDQDETGVTVEMVDATTGEALPDVRGEIAVACDGIRSVVRKQFYPDEGPPAYQGINMWRGVTTMKPILGGASMIRAGWLTHGKMVIYPINKALDENGDQLVNWVAELETPVYEERDWNRRGRVEDFIGPFEEWHFDWCDVPTMIRNASSVLEFPMVDQDPLPQWSFGRVTLLGDSAHPMLPRGSNGSAQAILDTVALGEELLKHDPVTALQAYEDRRRETTGAIVLRNRSNPPDVIVREVYERTGDKPFANIDDVISHAELKAIADSYRGVVGIDSNLAASAT